MANKKVTFDSAAFGRLEDILDGSVQLNLADEKEAVSACITMIDNMTGGTCKSFVDSVSQTRRQALAEAIALSKNLKRVSEDKQTFHQLREMLNRMRRWRMNQSRDGEIEIMIKFCASIRTYDPSHSITSASSHANVA